MTRQAAKRVMIPDFEPDVVHLITQVRRAWFSSGRAVGHLKEALQVENAEPLGRLGLALEEIEKARAALRALLGIDARGGDRA